MNENTKKTCRICRSYSYLSKEHVPPKSAFNKGRIKLAGHSFVFDSNELPWNLENAKGPIMQNGIYFQTICEKCNHRTNRDYVKAYSYFIKQIGYFLEKNTLKNKEKYTVPVRNIYPSLIIREVLSMFLTINGDGFSKKQKDFRKAVLNKKWNNLNPANFKIYIYLSAGEEILSKYIGLSAVRNIYAEGFKFNIVSEITSFPVSFVLSLNREPLANDYLDITSWIFEYKSDTKKNFDLFLPAYESNIGFPLDHRSRKEITDNT